MTHSKSLILVIIFLADDLRYKSHQAKNLLLRSSLNNNLQRTIYVNDLLLIKIVPVPKSAVTWLPWHRKKSGTFPYYFAGTFLGIQNNYLFINQKSTLGKNSITAININLLDAIYLGTDKNRELLYKRWIAFLTIVYYPIIGIPLLKNNPGTLSPDYDRFFGLFPTIGFASAPHGLLLGELHYRILKGKAQEFIISNEKLDNAWFIDNNY
tara:strand:+ start:386 stop:1015 length:630 start_codon:yes stop_codon:yes gene_type:complete